LELPEQAADDQADKAELENHLMLQGHDVHVTYYDPPNVHIPLHRAAQIQAEMTGDEQRLANPRTARPDAPAGRRAAGREGAGVAGRAARTRAARRTARPARADPPARRPHATPRQRHRRSQEDP
jgi:hypothetical protein